MNQPSSPSLAIRRRALFGGAAVAAGFAVLPRSALASPGRALRPGPKGFPGELVKRFRTPGTATAAGFRWWWPHGRVDPAEIAREVDQVADAGFGVLEVADVTHSLRARDIEIDVARYGWGTAPWVAGVKAALRRAAERDVRVDVTVGPSWPAAVPTITPDDEAACTELAHGRAAVAGGATYDGPVPEPVVAPHPASTRRHLVLVQAARAVGVDDEVTILAPDSVVDLTDQVGDGRISWTAPDEGDWVVLSYWRRGSAQEPEAGPHTDPRSYVVDHFSAVGAEAVVAIWEERVLDGELRRLLDAAGGYLFEDSLEIETDATVWTPNMLEEFQQRAGYDLRPYLPVVVEEDEDYRFEYDGVDNSRIRDDFNQVISDLYRDHHLVPLQEFARSLGLGLRVQPYGLETNANEHSSILDIPEGESLGFNNLDDYRVMAGGRDLAGRTVLSCEAAAYFGAAYNTTWDRALQTLNSIFVAGVNQAVLHGFAYAEAPEVTWPGFAAFSPYYNGSIGFGEAWGPRTPQWQHMPGIARYLARTQWVLQTGTPRYDLVFLRQKGWGSTGIGPVWVTRNGTALGWSHSFATAPLLDLPAAAVKDGVLAPDGPAYKAMVIEPDKFRGRELTMEVATARRVLELARDGLPVVLLGDWAQTAEPIGLARPGEVAELRELLSQLTALSTTRQVLDEGQIGAALADLGIDRDVEHESSTVQHLRRVVGDVDLYYLANAKHAENRRLNRVTQDLWLTAADPAAVPFRLDAWSGRITPIAEYRREGDRVRVRVDLVPGESVIVALAAVDDPVIGVVETSADAVRHENNRLLLRATSPGEHTVKLADGRTGTVTVDRVREPIAPSRWDLVVEDWQPGRSATDTVRRKRRAELDGVVPWSQVSGLEDASGIGTYRTVIDVGRDWTDADGALLELGEVNDTFRVRVNGDELPAGDPLVTAVDLGRRLRPGRNVVEVEIASTLLNRLRTVTPDVYGVASRQDYGLAGPVRLLPYVEQAIRT